MKRKTQAELKKMTKAEVVEYAQKLDPEVIVTELPEPQNVHEAMNYLMGRVGYVLKESSQDLPYTFASEPAFIRAVRPHMVDLGLTIHPIAIEHIETEIYQTKRGATAFNRVFLFTFRWTHAPSGTFFDVQTIGEGTDYGDKSCNKSMTVALKYAMRQPILIETGDDPDYDPSEQFEPAGTGKAKPRPSGNGLPRVDNQWEVDIVDDVMGVWDLARPHIVNILNHSIFRTTIPYGELSREFALAYLLAWDEAKTKYPDDDTEMRAKRINSNWEKIMEDFVETAIEMFGPEQESFDSGLGYDG